MPAKPERNGVFVSCVTDEFEKAKEGAPPAAFPGLRSQLDAYLRRSNCNVVVQEVFPQAEVDTLEKLDRLIRDRAATLHLIGELRGSVANEKAVASYLKAVPNFLETQTEMKAVLGDFSGITYTQWEAYIALHHDVPLFIYATDGGVKAQAEYLKRLRLARKYPGDKHITDPADLFGQLIGDIHTIIATVPKFERKIAPSRLSRHAAKQFFGRETELSLLDSAWADPSTHVLSLVAWGGVGKTSLVNQWIATRMIAKNWPGVERYYDWSFYSQGTGDSRQTSSDLFINDALTFFGDPDPVKGSPWERGVRLASLVRKHKTLLVLDGVEPLQYPPTDRSGQAGRLKDQALEALLQSLVQDNNGLCIVTTREHLANIDSYPTQTEHKLDKLMLDAAIGLIRHLQLIGTDEQIAEMWDALDGHALSMLQLGRLLARGYGKDLRRWREMGFTQADKLKQGRSTMKVMAKYEAWLAAGEKEQQLELAILRLMGLFEKPMSAGCFGAIREPPTIEGLTELFAGVENFELESAITTLIENELLSHAVGDDFAGPLLAVALDAHPLIREYFAQQLQKAHPDAFKEAHSRLFDYLCKSTPYRPDTLEGLAPLYESVTHGCLAGRQQEAYDDVYFNRILRGTEEDGGFYSTRKLAAIGADLAAVAAFFDEPWVRVCSHLRAESQGWLLRQAAVRLQSLGRMTEALRPIHASLEVATRLGDWNNAARRAANFSQVELILGRLEAAVEHAQWAIKSADRSGNIVMQILCRTKAADALHQAGNRGEAGKLFHDAESLQKGLKTERDVVYAQDGYRYCDWLLAPAERTAWQTILCFTDDVQSCKDAPDLVGCDRICDEVERRGTKMFEWRLPTDSLIATALDHLALARVGLVRAILANEFPRPTLDLPRVADASSGIRSAGAIDQLPRGMLTASLYHFVRGEHDLARKNLAEAQQIAERGPMPLHLADVHLHRARMFRDKDELAKAAKLIRDLGYGRRYDELADAEEAAKSW